MSAEWNIREIDWPAIGPAVRTPMADDREFAWLDTAVGDDGFSLLCTDPLARIEQFDQQPATLLIAGRVVDRDESGWRLWRRTLARLPRFPCGPSGLTPGWVGYVGFEMARQLERLPASHRADLGLPLLRLALFDRGIVLDHRRRRALAMTAAGLRVALGASARRGSDPPPTPSWQGGGCSTDTPSTSLGGTACQSDDADWVRRCEQVAAGGDGAAARATPELQLELDRGDHERAIRHALEYIAAGDIYQVNLAHRLRIDGIRDVRAAYAALRRVNPAPYAALLSWSDGAIASVSPELFLQLRGDHVLTRPIKGTRPRTHDPVRDEAYRRELITCEKEAAELAMIVDLHRNDLGRVCRYGSVQVTHPRRIETHPTVFHTVADVTGRLAPGRDGLDLLEACFPAGSISGVPKIRAIEIIDELEPVARGAYCGAVGVLGLDGQMTFNVAIRTLQIRGPAATLYVGGGIVADSDPAAEYEETLAKARGILSGLGVQSGEFGVTSAFGP